MDERTAAVAAVLTAGYGTKRAEAIVKCFPSFKAYVSAKKSDFDPKLFSPAAVEALSSPKIKEAEQIIELCDAKNITVITYFDDAFPKRLREIPEPPLVLYTAGRPLPELNVSPSITMVGTRDAKKQYMKFAALNGFSLAVLGFTVVSGVTPGIDAFSLKGALYGDGKAVAVLPCGIDMSPGTCDKLLMEVLRTKGTLVSEYPPKTPTNSWRYSRRNCILSGLTQSTLVVEASLTSGAISTADHALQQGRDLYAVPDEPYEVRSEGSNFLLRNGGVLATSFIDIVQDYNKKYGYGIDPFKYEKQLEKAYKSEYPIVRPNEFFQFETEDQNTAPKKKAEPVKKPAPKKTAPKKTAPTEEPEPKKEKAPVPALTGSEGEALALIRSHPSTADDLCEKLGLGFIEAVDLLANLSDKGLIKEGAGGVYTANNK